MNTEKELTGYPSIDKPWERFYESVEKRSIFLNTTPYQGLIKNNADYTSEIALEYFGAKITFGELIKNTDIVAKSMEAYGVKKGDYVTICSTTTPEVIYAFYAISKIGAVANVISPFYTPEELMARINECKSKLIIIVDKFLPKFKESLNKDKEKKVIVLPMMNSSFLRFITPKYKIDSSTNEIAWKTFIKDGTFRNDALVDSYEPQKPQAMVYSSESEYRTV